MAFVADLVTIVRVEGGAGPTTEMAVDGWRFELLLFA